MTEKRIDEIKNAAQDIMCATADLQLIVAHGLSLPKETAEKLFASLQGIKDLAGSMMRANGTRWDPEERAKLQCMNTLNALRSQLDQINAGNRLDDLNLYRLSAILENAQAKVKGYVLIKAEVA